MPVLVDANVEAGRGQFDEELITVTVQQRRRDDKALGLTVCVSERDLLAPSLDALSASEL